MTGYTVISNGLYMVLCGSIIYHLIFKCGGARVYFDKPVALYSLFFTICLFSISYSEYKNNAMYRVKVLFILGVFFILAYNYLVNTNNYKLMIVGMTVAGIVYAVYVIMYYGPSAYYELLLSGERAGSEITNVNTIGLISSTTFLLCIYYFLYHKKKFMLILSILPLITSLGSGSRKALVSCILSVFLFAFLKYKKSKNMKALVILVLSILIFYLAFQYILSLPAFSTISNRFETFTNSFTNKGRVDNSAKIRENMIKYGLKESKEHLIFGHGISNSNILTRKYFGTDTYLHNNYVELLYDVGLTGLLSYYSIFAWIFFKISKLLKEKKEYSQLFFVMLLIRLILDIGVVSYTEKETFVFLAAVSVYIKLNEQAERNFSDEQAVKSN